jgi:4-hydroxy-tetrahydrodipicolinate reductase
MKLKLAIAGAGGRMGRALVRAAFEASGVQVLAATERPDGGLVGEDAGELAGLGPIDVRVGADVLSETPQADVFVDFTTPRATLAALEALAGQSGAPCRAAVVGTTGFSAEEEVRLATLAGELAIVRSGNFSLGVNLLAVFVEQAAARLGSDWDVEVLETHHRLKADAPSGTALLLAEAAAAGRGEALSTLTRPPDLGQTGPRPEGSIGFAVRRAGGVVGEHEVMFASTEEVVRLSHSALDRTVFAKGALAAARWVAGRPPGLYSMRDVLGL